MTSSQSWTDFSDYLIHFTRPTESDDSVGVFLSILSQACIRRSHRPSGAAKGLRILGDTQRCVSLTEVPPGAWDRLIANRSSHGLAFSKPLIASKGGAPVWYLEKDSPVQRIAFDLFSTAQTRDPEHPIWRLTPFIDFPGSYPSGTYRYEWEREWRVPGDLVYSTRDVSFLLIPEGEHRQARDFFCNARTEGTGPVYDCPLIDPMWEADRIRDALRHADSSGLSRNEP